MKRKKLAIGLMMLALVLPAGIPASAQTSDIELAIQRGLSWLVQQQVIADGGWGHPDYCERVAKTGFAVLKLNTYAIEHGIDPLDPNYQYATQVSDGLDFILSNKHTIDIAMEPAGDPDGNGNGIGVYFVDCPQHQMYNTGIAMMALATSGHPELYGDVLQDAVDFVAYAQADPGCGVHRGGWRYWPDVCASDNSNSGYVTLGLGFASYAPPWGFGLEIPPWVLDELDIWIDQIQDPATGCSNYAHLDPRFNILKQGNLLYEMALVGDGVETPRVQKALDCLVGFWDQSGWMSGWTRHNQAMFTMMKGFQALGIDRIDLNGDGVPEHDWFEEVSAHLVYYQVYPPGWWHEEPWGGRLLATEWALLTLEKAVPRPVLEIEVQTDNDADGDGGYNDIETVPAGAPYPVTVAYQVQITNSGNVDGTLTEISDDTHDLSGLVCTHGDGTTTFGLGQIPGEPIAGNETVVCVFDAVFGTADEASVTNTVSVSAESSAGSCTGSDTSTVQLTQNPSLAIGTTSTTAEVTAAGQVVDYSFGVTNDGNVTLHNVVVTASNVDDPPGMSCPGTQLAAGESMTCSAQHTVTQAEMDAGGILSNTGVADADETDPVQDQLQIPIAQKLLVALDIKPTSCPNPLEVEKKGVIPMTILGTGDLDVTQIDPASARIVIDLENPNLDVYPLRWAYEDVAAPFVPFLGREDCWADCTEAGPDGYLDLTFKFDAQEVVAALGELTDEQCLVLTIAGNLMEAYGGRPLVGEDVVRILK